ncbi:cellulose-binding protein [Streptomyces sp. NPDC086091]|uniref:cellulose-binding protein n=1 Tax=Streptomyces sp. NPDC086091 TaxID=3365751 RepID=UPI0038259A93
MIGTPVPPPGYETVRGRGYRPEQVEAYTAALCADRDAAWERAARLTVLAKQMRSRAAALRETVAGLAPQTYEGLGERARTVFRLAQTEAADVRERARRAGVDEVERAQAYGRDLRRSAREEGERVRAAAEEYARERMLRARAEADGVRIGARRAVREGRGAALALVREARRRGAELLAAQQREQTERWEAAEQEAAERTAVLDAQHAAALARAEAALADAEHAVATAGTAGRRAHEEARGRAAEIVAEARVRAEGVARETERVLREHGERWDEVQGQIASVRSSLNVLTARGVE